MRKKEIIEGENFFLVKEQEKRWEDYPTIIKSSGYTSDRKAITEPWLFTQIRTLPFRNRSNKPDPLIFEENDRLVRFCFPLREVYDFYLKPNCKGIADAQAELSSYINNSSKKFEFVGHSKGGLLFAGLELKEPTKMALVAPTFGTIMGDEKRLKSCIKTYMCLEKSLSIWRKMELQVYEQLAHIIGSRRPVDLDMALESDYLKTKNFDNLWKHQILLIIAEYSQARWNLQDAFFSHVGDFLDMGKGDGIVSLFNQSRIRRYADEVMLVEATHPTVLHKPETWIRLKSFFR